MASGQQVSSLLQNQAGHEGSRIPNKVFIQRDYSEGTSVKFQTKFPQELDGLIERHMFDQMVTTINSIYSEAERMSGKTFCEGFMACLTAYLLYMCTETHYEKFLKQATAYIHEQNETVYGPRGLHITDPIERGLRVIEITILSEQGARS
uniref:Ras modification protein ERF4 n=1 Tax=Hyalomma excavatum TaxID=257692 RepID=A0A131XDI5_9ACAR